MGQNSNGDIAEAARGQPSSNARQAAPGTAQRVFGLPQPLSLRLRQDNVRE
jgi:hypothetical protein